MQENLAASNLSYHKMENKQTGVVGGGEKQNGEKGIYTYTFFFNRSKYLKIATLLIWLHLRRQYFFFFYFFKLLWLLNIELF